MKKLYFKGIETIDELKKSYKRLVFELHPDRNSIDTTKQFQEMQQQYNEKFEEVKNFHLNKDGEKYEKETTEKPETFINIINRLITIQSITIEIIGDWLWVSGNTKEIKDTLKELKMRYSGNKKAWYYHEGKFYKKSRHDWNMDELRNEFGTEKVENKQVTLFAN